MSYSKSKRKLNDEEREYLIKEIPILNKHNKTNVKVIIILVIVGFALSFLMGMIIGDGDTDAIDIILIVLPAGLFFGFFLCNT